MMTAGGRSTLLEVRHLHVAYGKVEAVRDISLKVGRGTIVRLLFPDPLPRQRAKPARD